MPVPKRYPEIDKSHIEIKSWNDFHEKMGQLSDSQWIFRGVSSKQHYLIPSIGRESIYGAYKLAHEKRLFNAFRLRAVSLNKDSRFGDWDWLAFAQHVGVPTRLLDLSTSAMVAAYFALEKERDEKNEEDRVIYCVSLSQYLHEVEHESSGPFQVKKVGRFTAPYLFDRIRAQRGVFTIHPVPTEVYRPSKMKSYLIPKEQVNGFRKKLYKYGTDSFSVYPDIQGLAQQMQWQYKKKIGLGSIFLKLK